MHQSSTKHKKIYNTHVVELKRLAQVVVARMVGGRVGGFSVIHCVYGVVIFDICRGRSAEARLVVVCKNYVERIRFSCYRVGIEMCASASFP